MKGHENLIPASDPRGHKLTVAEQSAGGKKSVEARRQKKSWKQILEMLGGMEVKNKNYKNLMNAANIPENEQISDVAKLFILDSKSRAGDMKALELEAKIRGQFAPIKNVNENHNVEYKPLVNLTERKKNGE